MAKTLVIHPERCMACLAFELACSMKHHGEFNPSRSRIQVNVFPEDALFIPTACTQYEQAWCAKIRPTNATIRDPATRIFEGLWREKGHTVRTSLRAAEIVRKAGRAAGVRLEDGEILPCQVCFLAVGVRPNLEFLEGRRSSADGER